MRCPMSVVVPPTSTTMASSSPDRNAAPRMLFVGLEENEYTGNASAWAASMTVPSFCVRYSGASMPEAATASVNARVVRLANEARRLVGAALVQLL